MGKKLSILVPYRDRHEHLIKFIPHMKEFFSINHPNIEYTINIIEQSNSKSFNRGKLLNVGFDLTKEHHDYFCLHDVDMLPLNSECDYSCDQSPIHLAGAAKQFGYQMPYSTYFGGVTLFKKEHYVKINGFCNDYWGWGVEDDDLYSRCKINNLNVYKKNGRYDSLPHKKNEFDEKGNVNPDVSKNRQTFSKKMQILSQLSSEGLSTLTYTLIEIVDIENNVKLYKVDI